MKILAPPLTVRYPWNTPTPLLLKNQKVGFPDNNYTMILCKFLKSFTIDYSLKVLCMSIREF